MRKTYQVRTEVINATAKQWAWIDKISVRGVIAANPQDLFEVVGFFGGLSGKFNDEEKAFFSAFEEAARQFV